VYYMAAKTRGDI